ncbi:MAG TPA: AAA family ATPase [Mycobacteriales bacterium]|nr:AAA family ATPase [Mycobacteriales bacterium]
MADTAFEAFCEAGLWPGLSRALARSLPGVHINGPDDVTVDAVGALEGVTKDRAEKLVKSFASARPRLAVAELLFAASLAVRPAFGAVEAFGPDAADVLRDDPWRLLEVAGVDVRTADRFALATLEDRPEKTDPRRGSAQVAYALARAARDGHTVVPEVTIVAALGGLDAPDPQAALLAAVDDGRVLAFEEYDAEAAVHRLYGLERYAMAEAAVAEGIERLVAEAEPFCRSDEAIVDGDELDEAQRDAVVAVAQHGVTVLHGGPGTGKSRTVAAVVAMAARHGKDVALAAPTGRAAKRLAELTGHEATTLHRLLQAQGTSGEFLRNEAWRLDADLVVVDEASMLDAELAAALLDACQDGTHLMFVGDPAQLPSIGAGRVLGDILDSESVPATELTILHRQAEGGTIARLATAVRHGELPIVADPTKEVVVIAADGPADAARRVTQLVTDSIPRVFGIPPGDIQVLTPVHRGSAGTEALNTALKAALNPGEGAVSGFDAGDRVVATANHLDNGFANGEVGSVSEATESLFAVDFGAGPIAVPPKAMRDLVHGWAITVHRAQGSEWPAVVVVLPPEATGMLSRPLVYTALTRAQRHLSIVHAAGPTLARGVRDIGARPRRTRLAGLLSGAA